MNRLSRFVQASIAAVLIAVAAPATVHATPPDSIKFETVDSVQYLDREELVVKGILVGQTQAVEFVFFFSSSNTSDCHKQALIAMDRPGRYQLDIASSPDGGHSCKLIRR